MGALFFIFLLFVVLVLYGIMLYRNIVWVFRWLFCIVPAFMFCLLGGGAGALYGTFAPYPATAWRREFFDHFIACVGNTPDFPAAIAAMQQWLDSEISVQLFARVLPAPPAPAGYIAIGVVIIGAMIVCECRRQLPGRRTLLFVLPLLLYGTAAWYCQRVYFRIFALAHLRDTQRYEELMLEDFAKRAGEVTLPAAAIQAALRDYIEQWSSVCHGEPYSDLEEKLWHNPVPELENSGNHGTVSATNEENDK